ncbi:ExbD/TolR family protein [Neotamlana laminarinivorans]|uniref:Biopolymer transporter ExbD n=1 Tax=Neotamlana laminarinivorans TaxID=2883124 RepID=A0A9X1I5B9_9FLAO|nr:biopolymer transporter ExbD [Tamlana laminarinivorans]MCB4800274.1 biopolymer transporter ExbD [Tamlana laminarinivorans]
MKLKISISCLFILAFFSCINDKGLVKELPEVSETKTEYDLSKAINIYIDGSNQLLVDNEKLDIDELKTKVREYENKNKSESIISIKNAPESSYSTFIDVQNAIVGEIRILRETLSKEKYNIELDSLTKEQLSEIRKVYPLNLAE